jgi:hypothetical protein
LGHLDWSQVPDSQIPARKVELTTTARRKAAKFIPPMPLDWYQRACRLRGKAPVVATVLWYLSRLKKSKTIVLSQTRLNEFGITRQAKYRALRALESAGLVKVHPRGRKSSEVTLLSLPASYG